MAAVEMVDVLFEVPGGERRARVDAYLARRLHRYSRAEVQRLIDDGRVLVRGTPVKAASRVSPGDRIIVRYPKREEPPPRYERLEVLYEDDHLVAVSKPGDVISHPTDKVLRAAATSILREQFGRPLLLAHRLDRETSGVLLLAKDRDSARSLVDQFTRREVSKRYLALAQGRVAFERELVDRPIGREGLEIKVRQAIVAGGRPAVTEFRRLAASDRLSLVLAAPRTGRLHQIRVHLASLGHPVAGDKLYQGEGEAYLKAIRKELSSADLDALGASRQMLHAWTIRFTHPVTGRELKIAAPPPPDFAACAEAGGLALDRALAGAAG